MSIYTKKGDSGTTALLGLSERVSKDAQRIVALGCLDELNSQLGVAVSFLTQDQSSLLEEIRSIQQDLFEINTEVATVAPRDPPFLADSDKARRLERFIDQQEAGLPPLSHFIYLGGSPAGAALHLARSVCRRAEREVVRLSRKEDVNASIARYLNRLSDALFVMARLANHLAGSPEEPWKGK
ncbi:MAG: ATP:cob(I)alamin adenosyltransferase [Candidatus Blackburnbacteria bacterium RIFCSPHIGHO2_01_FULL_43_15b]|uniref:Corrinoid adenosyltransferase n=1 Tax=Candidatus Blackburnbacteria bacterium RIFCSPHIGHO2_01_FULL_43_15b TaxID=1797513 RepID=A0A1G1V1Z3_9BACT|nr:MAG: ATP:cob(I)alamin adenosyltransferase [Candidatus Blackburnbacteria bacterium RIFCSPHIGHO2_01_FULL_43_15b]